MLCWDGWSEYSVFEATSRFRWQHRAERSHSLLLGKFLLLNLVYVGEWILEGFPNCHTWPTVLLLMLCVPSSQALPRWLSPTFHLRTPHPVCSPWSSPRHRQLPYTPRETQVWCATHSPIISFRPCLLSCTHSGSQCRPCFCTLPPPFKVWIPCCIPTCKMT